MPYDPTTDALDRLRDEVHRLRQDQSKASLERMRDTTDLIGWLGVAAIVGIAAYFTLLIAVIGIYKRLREACGCG